MHRSHGKTASLSLVHERRRTLKARSRLQRANVAAEPDNRERRRRKKIRLQRGTDRCNPHRPFRHAI